MQTSCAPLIPPICTAAGLCDSTRAARQLQKQLRRKKANAIVFSETRAIERTASNIINRRRIIEGAASSFAQRFKLRVHTLRTPRRARQQSKLRPLSFGLPKTAAFWAHSVSQARRQASLSVCRLCTRTTRNRVFAHVSTLTSKKAAAFNEFIFRSSSESSCATNDTATLDRPGARHLATSF